jgi:hypothetical protein
MNPGSLERFQTLSCDEIKESKQDDWVIAKKERWTLRMDWEHSLLRVSTPSDTQKTEQLLFLAPVVIEYSTRGTISAWKSLSAIDLQVLRSVIGPHEPLITDFSFFSGIKRKNPKDTNIVQFRRVFHQNHGYTPDFPCRVVSESGVKKR